MFGECVFRNTAKHTVWRRVHGPTYLPTCPPEAAFSFSLLQVLPFPLSFFHHLIVHHVHRGNFSPVVGLADWDDHTIDIDHTVPACQPCTNITALQRSSYVHASPYVKSHVNLQVIRLTQTHIYISGTG